MSLLLALCLLADPTFTDVMLVNLQTKVPEGLWDGEVIDLKVNTLIARLALEKERDIRLFEAVHKLQQWVNPGTTRKEYDELVAGVKKDLDALKKKFGTLEYMTSEQYESLQARRKELLPKKGYKRWTPSDGAYVEMKIGGGRVNDKIFPGTSFVFFSYGNDDKERAESSKRINKLVNEAMERHEAPFNKALNDFGKDPDRN